MASLFLKKNLNLKRPLYSGLLSVTGINLWSNHFIIAKLGWESCFLLNKLSTKQFKLLYSLINVFERKFEKAFELKQLKFERHIKLKTFLGFRLIFKKPLRGQRTHSNANTRRRRNVL